MGPSRFPPFYTAAVPLKMSTIKYGSFTFPNGTVSLIRALKFSCLDQFKAAPSRMLTWTNECRYVVTSGSKKHMSRRARIPPLTSLIFSLVFGFLSSPVRYRLCVLHQQNHQPCRTLGGVVIQTRVGFPHR